jgi:hypothetical protein
MRIAGGFSGIAAYERFSEKLVPYDLLDRPIHS